jgi:DUF1680 family protein
MKKILYLLLFVCLLAPAKNTHAGGKGFDYPLQEVAYYNVNVTGGLWKMRIDSCIKNTVWDNLRKLTSSGKIDNFSIAAGIKNGDFKSNEASDSDVYKTIQGACYSLKLHSDPALERFTDSLIAIIGKVQEPDGYLYTIRYFKPLGNKCIGGRWANLSHSHELYNLGHMIEAAVAHYEATGKRNFLNMAIKTADLISGTFGPDRLRDIPGHQEIELALAKLYKVTGKKDYIDVAKFFLNERGHYNNGRVQYVFRNNLTYYQDHKPVLEQEETTGHAVRACYMYAGMVDVGAMSGNVEYIQASNRLWENATGKKIYLTGGVGASDTKGEAFDEEYMLPNLNAYSETCGAVANMLWNFRLGKYYKDAKYFDVLERTLYNGYLPSCSVHGVGYFYTNPLADRGKKNRSGWFDPPCCPTNISRTTTSVPGYLYLTDNDNLYINLFMNSESKIEFGGRAVGVNQETAYPWDGEVKFRVSIEKPSSFTLKIRVPGWAREEAIPLGLYRYMSKTKKEFSIKLNGAMQKVNLDKGYAVLQKKWQTGDEIILSLPMEVRRVLSDERVKENKGRVALERGPLVYCAEWVDNNGKTSNIILPDQTKLSSAYMKDLIGGVTVIKGKAKTVDKNGKAISSDFTAIPYFAWLNRGKGEMDIWLPRTIALMKK